MEYNDNQLSRAEDDQEQLSRRLREAREYLGISQEFVAEQLGIPRASISALETGKRKVSSIELKQLAHLYKVPTSYLLGENEIAQIELQSPTIHALFRTTRTLTEKDREQVLRFAQFLQESQRNANVSDDPPTHE